MQFPGLKALHLLDWINNDIREFGMKIKRKRLTFINLLCFFLNYYFQLSSNEFLNNYTKCKQIKNIAKMSLKKIRKILNFHIFKACEKSSQLLKWPR
jgi:hypothetical protein